MLPSRSNLLLIFCLSTGSALHTTSPEFCDRSLTYSPRDPYGYSARQGRCEGRYRTQNAGEPFIIAGYVSGARTFSVPSAPTVRLSWPDVGGDSVKIRASSLNGAVPYQMDTRVRASVHEFRWPTEILRAVRLNGEELGIRASIVRSSGEERDSLLIPLSINAVEDLTPHLVIYSVRALRITYLSIRDPRTEQLVVPPAVVTTAVSAPQRFLISLPAVLPTGRYHVEVSAITVDGRPATADAQILIPARPNAP